MHFWIYTQLDCQSSPAYKGTSFRDSTRLNPNSCSEKHCTRKVRAQRREQWRQRVWGLRGWGLKRRGRVLKREWREWLVEREGGCFWGSAEGSFIIMKKAERTSHYSMKSIINSVYERANLPALLDSLKPIAPQLRALDDLLEVEKKLDSLIKRKRCDLVDLFAQPPVQVSRVLRVHLLLAPHQGDSRLTVRGYLFPHELQTGKLTQFVKSVTVSCGQTEQGDIAWRKSPHSGSAQHQGLSFKLQGKPSTCVVSLQLIHNPAKYSLDTYLQKIVGMQRGTRTQVIQRLWQYIMRHQLLDPEVKEVVNDAVMTQAFKCERMSVGSINGKLRDLLSNLQPIELTLALGEERVIDVQVQLEMHPEVEALPLMASRLGELDKGRELYFQRLNKRIKKIDKNIVEYIQKLERFKDKRERYLAFADGPSTFVQELVQEQNDLLKIINEKDPMRRCDPRRLDYLLENEEELEREVISYLESQGK